MRAAVTRWGLICRMRQGWEDLADIGVDWRLMDMQVI